MHSPRKRETPRGVRGFESLTLRSSTTEVLLEDFDFDFPDWGRACKDCEVVIDLIYCRSSGLCNDCEFDSLTPPAWLEVFLVRLARWRTHEAS